MASRIKEDEKNEKIIRGLLRLPANKKCINCNSLGPQYVCTNFWTFICTNCSGIHREFTHRVKSVSMAKFTSQEVTALQEGGNERAKEIFFKEWDHQRHSFPDSSNVEKLRTFIKQVYVDRRYNGDKSVDRPQKGNKEDSYEQRRPETFRGSSRSPSYDDAFDRRSTGRNDDSGSRYNFDERNPGYDRGDYRRSPGRIESVDDRRRDDRFGKGNSNSRFDDRRVSDGKSPNHQRSVDTPSPPIVRPVRDILGEGAPSLVVGEPPKSNGSRVVESPSQSQALKTAPSSIVTSTTGATSSEVKSVGTITTAEVKSAEPKSLIDFSADFDPPASSQQQSVPQQASGLPVDAGNWASFDSVTVQKPVNITNSNPLESALSQLYAPGNTNIVSNTSTLPTVGQIPASQQNTSSLFATIASQDTIPQSVVPQINPLVAGSINQQAWASPPVSVGVGQMTTSSGYASQASIIPNAETRPGGSLQPQVTEAKLNERKELPADLFTLTYPMGAGAVPGWQARPQYGMGFGMQYPTMMQVPSFPYAVKPANPFDVSNESTLVHATTFPSMAPLQAALPTAVDPLGHPRSSSLGANPQWMAPQQLPYPIATVPALGGYMSQVQNSTGQQTSFSFLSSGCHHRNEAVGDVGLQRIPSGMSGTDQNLNAIYLQQSSNSFTPSSGNPFG